MRAPRSASSTAPIRRTRAPPAGCSPTSAEDLARDGREVRVVAGPPAGGAPGARGRRPRPGAREASRRARGVTRADLRAWGTRRPNRGALPRARRTTCPSSARRRSPGSRLPRPDVVDAPDRSADHRPGRARVGTAVARAFVFLCQDVFPEVARLLEDFRSERVDRLLDRVTRLLLRRADRVVAIGETMARASRGQGRRPRPRHGHPQLGGLRRPSCPAPKKNPFAEPTAWPSGSS